MAAAARRTGRRAGRGDLGRVADQAGPADGGVGGDDSVQAEFGREVRDRVDVAVGQVWRDLDEQWHPSGASWLPGRPAGNVIERGAHRGQQRPQRRDRLKVPQAGRIRRTDVDHHVVGYRGHQPGAGHVVRDRLVRRSGLGLADVHPDDDRTSPTPAQRAPPAPSAAWVTRAPAIAAPSQLLRRGRRTRVVEAHPVHHRPVRGQPEHPRPRVTRLRVRRHRTDLNEREAERAERVRAAGVLVEPGGQPQRPGQVQPERPHPEDRIPRREPAPQQPRPTGHRARRADQPEPGRVRGLGRKPPQQHPVHHLIHGSMVAPRATWPGQSALKYRATGSRT